VDSRLYRNLPVVLTPLGCANARAFVRCAQSGVAVLLASGIGARVCDPEVERGDRTGGRHQGPTLSGFLVRRYRGPGIQGCRQHARMRILLCGLWFRMQNAPDHGWSGAFWDVVFGGVLLSHTLSSAVPSALEGLASGFGMPP
jgi:hypothetical protein